MKTERHEIPFCRVNRFNRKDFSYDDSSSFFYHKVIMFLMVKDTPIHYNTMPNGADCALHCHPNIKMLFLSAQ